MAEKRGGKRPGAGRPKGSRDRATKTAKATKTVLAKKGEAGGGDRTRSRASEVVKRRRLQLRKVTDLPEPPRAKWHAAQTNARSEELVNLMLRERGWWTFYPQRLTTVTHARKTDEVLRPYLPRYVFLSSLPHQDVFDVNELPGVSTVLWSAGGPLVINDRDIAVMQARADREGVIRDEPAAEAPRVVFEPGTKLCVQQGPFIGFEGEVIAMETSAGAQYVALALEFLGGPTKASLPVGWVANV